MTEAFGMIEVALKEILEEGAGATGKVGGDLSYDGSTDFYIYVAQVPGGQADQIYGSWTVDIDVFATSYVTAMRKALGIEALLVGRRHISTEMRIDHCTENVAPAERPWEDDGVFRVGATYYFTARRTG